MKRLTDTIQKIDQTNSSKLKIEALENYFRTEKESEKIFCVALFTGKKPKGVVRSAQLRTWAAEISGLPEWLFEETYHIVGDLAETIAKILLSSTNEKRTDTQSLETIFNQLQELKSSTEEKKRKYVTEMWAVLNDKERFVFNKMLTGGFRIGVSQKMMTKALSQVINKEESEISYHLMGNWDPLKINFNGLFFSKEDKANKAHPYPFCLAHPLVNEVSSLGSPEDWCAEYKWDGIRGQLIYRQGELFLWSRGEELITHQFPEFESIKNTFSDHFVIDGEILVKRKGAIQPFTDLQKRLGRKSPGKKTISDYPAHFIAYDILEYNDLNLCSHPLKTRKKVLNDLLSPSPNDLISISTTIHFDHWTTLEKARSNARTIGTEGLMLKNYRSIYTAGRKTGSWWKWKIDPFTIDVVMVYAMRGHGRRANLFSDYTFALWEKGELLTVTKAYSGLTDKEMKEVDQFIKKNTIEKFGPVSSVAPEMVFEIAFDGLMKSSRHKSGFALRFPRIKRIRHDKSAKEANSLEDLEKLYNIYIKKEE